MKRILISGGAGFIGSHLCERLLDEGNDVICIDNYFTGHKSNIRHLLKHPNFEVIRHDIIYPYMAEVEEISTTLPVLLRPSTTSTTRSRRRKLRLSAR